MRLIEDDETDREVILRCLQSRAGHFIVQGVPTACEAWQILCGEAGHRPLLKPDVIVIDLDLPGVDGFEFLQRVRQDPDHQASVVLVLTAQTMNKMGDGCRRTMWRDTP